MSVEPGFPGSLVFHAMPVDVAMVTGFPPWYQLFCASHRIVRVRTTRRTIEVLMDSVVAMACNRHPLMTTLARLELQNVKFRLAVVRFGA